MRVRKILFILAILLLNHSFASTIYKVERGDHLMHISNKFYGTHQLWREVRDANPNIEPKDLKVGDNLIIPTLDPQLIAKTKKKFEFLNKGNKKIVIEKKKKTSQKIVTIKDSPKKSTEPEIDYKAAFLKIKKENLELRKELADQEQTIQKLENWTNERENLIKEVSRLRNHLKDSQGQVAKLESKNEYFYPNQIAYDMEQVLKEKTRILGHRFWVEKNKDFAQCEVKVSNFKGTTKEDFLDFIAFIDQTIGKDSVMVDPSNNELVVKLSGRTAYGVENPKLRNEYKLKLSKISNYLKKLPVKGIHISSTPHTNTISSEDGSKISGHLFSLRQGSVISDFFQNNLGWGTQNLSFGATGAISNPSRKPKKEFALKVQLFNGLPKEQSRTPSSEEDHTKSFIQDFQNRLLSHLGEPKYLQFETSPDALKINLGRHYFFGDDPSKLKSRGKDYLEKIIALVNNAPDLEVSLMWAPGLYENESEIKTRSTKEIVTLIDYLKSHHEKFANNLEVGVLDKSKKLKEASNRYQDIMNRRLRIELRPKSVGFKRSYGFY